MTAGAMTESTPRWDRRVLNASGNPAPRYQLPWSRGWFTIRRADGPAGVVLEARIPGYLTATAQHEDQKAAEAAARDIWLRYAADVNTATGQEQEINEPWAS